MNFFEAFPVFKKIIRNPSNPIFRGISCFFYPFPWFLRLDSSLILLRDFPIFSIRFLIFWIRFRFSKKVSKSQFFERFPLLLGLLPHFLGQIPVFKKVLNSQFVDRFPLFFRSVSGFQKRNFKSQFVSQFPLYLGSFPVFKKC